MRKELQEIWPEIEWIEDADLKEKVYETWEYALEQSVLSAEDLLSIPFTLLIEDCQVTFMEHKRAVVHIAVDSAKAMQRFFGDKLPINMDYLIAGAILIDVGKLIEYVKDGETAVVGNTGRLLRHPFSGVALAMRNSSARGLGNDATSVPPGFSTRCSSPAARRTSGTCSST